MGKNISKRNEEKLKVYLAKIEQEKKQQEKAATKKP